MLVPKDKHKNTLIDYSEIRHKRLRAEGIRPRKVGVIESASEECELKSTARLFGLGIYFENFEESSESCSARKDHPVKLLSLKINVCTTNSILQRRYSNF